jgi:hypothetical protein
MTQLRIRRINLSSLFGHGCTLGVAQGVLPSLVCGLGLLWVSHLAQSWVASWQAMTINLLGQEVARIDLVHVLGLEQIVEFLHAVTAASPLVILVSIAWIAIALGLLLATAALFLGLAYNGLASLTGGVIIEARARPLRSQGSTRE